MLLLLNGFGERALVLHDWMEIFPQLAHAANLLCACGSARLHSSLGHFGREQIYRATLQTHARSCRRRVGQLEVMGNTCKSHVHQPCTSSTAEYLHVCIFAGGRKVWTSAAYFLLSTLLRPSFIFLFVLSAFSGPSLTPQMCEHNLLPPSETGLMLHIPLGWETSQDCLPPCPPAPCLGPCGCVHTTILSPGTPKQQEAGKNSIEIRKLSRRGSLRSKGWNILPVCHWGYLLCCDWIEGAQSILQSLWEGALGAGLALCCRSML